MTIRKKSIVTWIPYRVILAQLGAKTFIDIGLCLKNHRTKLHTSHQNSFEATIQNSVPSQSTSIFLNFVSKCFATFISFY